MRIQEVIQLPEGRRLEFKQEIPAAADLAKTIVAFANDAGGELYLGIRNNPRELLGIPEAEMRKVVIAPIFKHMGVIDQWGNGLKIISDELKAYPEIEFKWFEKGLQFQVQFIKKNYQPEAEQALDLDSIGRELGNRLGLSWDQVGTRSGPSRHQVGTKSALSWHQVESLLAFTETPKSIKELMELLEWKDRTKFRAKYITPLLEKELISMTIPDKPNSSLQQYMLTETGKKLLALLTHS